MSIVTILQEQMVTSNKVSLNSSNDLPSSDLSLNQSEGEDAFEPMRTTRECGWCYLLLGFVILCTMLGNLMVCLAVIFDKRLQNITNFFLVSLAMTDMGVAVLVMPFAIVVAYNSGLWPMGNLVCNVYLHVDVLLCTSSILHLTIISLDRFLVIKYPLRHKIHGGSRCSTVLKISLVWILSIMVAFPGYLIRNTIHSSPDKPTVAENNFLSEKGECGYFDTSQLFIIYSATGSFFLPATIMAVLYFVTIMELYGSTEFSRRADAKRNVAGIHSSEAKSFVQRMTFQSAQKKAMKVLGVVFTCFLISWCPFFVTYCLQGVWHVEISPNWNLFVQWLGYLNSMLNPIIYTLFNQNFRRAFVLICQFKFNELKMQRPRMITNQLQLARINSMHHHQCQNNPDRVYNIRRANMGCNISNNNNNKPPTATHITASTNIIPPYDECNIYLPFPGGQRTGAKYRCYKSMLVQQDFSISANGVAGCSYHRANHTNSCNGRITSISETSRNKSSNSESVPSKPRSSSSFS